jgi:uncharacterized protein
MSKMITPGVYINEMNAFPNAVVQVETSVPIFIGYTQIAVKEGKSLLQKPKRISSLQEYENYFGKGFRPRFNIVDALPTKNETIFVLNGSNKQAIINTNNKLIFYNSIKLFYQNGGADCYIMSVGTYAEKPEGMPIDATDFLGNATKPNVFTLLEKEAEPTLIILPDVINMGIAAYPIYQEALAHCEKMQSRFAILDVYQTSKTSLQNDIQFFRDGIGNVGLKYGAAYYPWLNTTIVQDDEIDFTNLDDSVHLVDLLPEEAAKNIVNNIKILTPEQLEIQRVNLHQSLKVSSSSYQKIMGAIKNELNLLPASAAMAGVYTSVDSSRGVWKAPANVSLAAVISASIHISKDEQEDLNVPFSGKFICVIRNFLGKGTLVWGARTLNGNDMEWRYISVRRTGIMIEQSIKLALSIFVFEPNDANTWVTVKSMVENFLTNLWIQGCLNGAKPEYAFFVNIGLGSTMTSNDILEGRMLLSVGVAMVRPAEFIIINFEQMQQKS